MDESVSTIPTMGFNVESIQYKNLSFQAWDLGDSSDRDRIGVSQKEFELMLQEAELKNAVLLVLANKQDVKGAMTQAEVSEHLGLPSIKNRQWAIYRCVATEGTGIEEGFDWVANAIKNA
ncbi:Arf GTPase arl1 [Mycoemilia scoparia]|uniref:Arf GTPase arl1 n=1 Tax=Mycoemilia scoparia TaxID=417184 RepID=A0A9W8A489_9FUNG|nr:Arf GTPase arl1 [Mycoemilia scoparia]